MDYKEKWITLKDYMEKVVMWGSQQVDQIGIEDQNRLAAYKHMLGYMNRLDGSEKTIQTLDGERMNKIIDEIVAEKFDDLSK